MKQYQLRFLPNTTAAIDTAAGRSKNSTPVSGEASGSSAEVPAGASLSEAGSVSESSAGAVSAGVSSPSFETVSETSLKLLRFVL